MSNALTLQDEFKSYLEQHQDQIAAALPSHLKPERMIRLALTSFSQNKQLAECRYESIFGSILLASQLGLEIGVLGQGFLVPYKGVCSFVPGWKGLVDIAGRSGKATVWTGAVFEGDQFEFALGDSPYVKHVPCGEDDPSLLTHCYAIGRVTGSQWPVVEVWPIARIRRHFAKFNKVGDRHYAHRNWEMYARKVPLLQVLKYMPTSVELSTAIQAAYDLESYDSAAGDGDVIDGAGQVVGKTTVQAPQRRSAAKGQPASAAPAPSQAANTTETPASTTTAAPRSEPATAGEVMWVKNNLQRTGMAEAEALSRAGLASLDSLTKDGFKALQQVIRSAR